MCISDFKMYFHATLKLNWTKQMHCICVWDYPTMNQISFGNILPLNSFCLYIAYCISIHINVLTISWYRNKAKFGFRSDPYIILINEILQSLMRFIFVTYANWGSISVKYETRKHHDQQINSRKTWCSF